MVLIGLVSKNQGKSGLKNEEWSIKSGQKPGVFVNLWSFSAWKCKSNQGSAEIAQ